MKKYIKSFTPTQLCLLIAILIILGIGCHNRGMAQDKPKPDTLHYKFKEPDVALIDNLVGQLDVLAGNSDKISTAQYNVIHRSVIHLDSLIKSQYFRFHQVKEQPKKDQK